MTTKRLFLRIGVVLWFLTLAISFAGYMYYLRLLILTFASLL